LGRYWLNTNEHEHDENCGCGGMIPVPTEDGGTILCDILGTFEYQDVTYIALTPQEGDEDADPDDESEEVLFYRYAERYEGITLTSIETEEELDEVVEAFFEIYGEDFDDDDDLYDLDFDEDDDDLDFDDDEDFDEEA